MATEHLTPSDFATATWQRVTAYGLDQIEQLRTKLEKGDDETARGQIKALRRLLGLPAEAAASAQTEPPVSY